MAGGLLDAVGRSCQRQCSSSYSLRDGLQRLGRQTTFTPRAVQRRKHLLRRCSAEAQDASASSGGSWEGARPARLDIDLEWQDFASQRRRLPPHLRSFDGAADEGDSSMTHFRRPQPSWDPVELELPPDHPDHPDNAYTPFPGRPLSYSSGSEADMDVLGPKPVYSLNSAMPWREFTLDDGDTQIWDSLPQVHVILFGVGSGDAEGIYSLRALSDEGDPSVDTIVAFESAEDAQRYATLLEATMSHDPAVVPISPRELLEFCAEAGYQARLELPGSSIMPPDYNVGITDWERSLRLRSGLSYMIGTEEEGAGGSFTSAMAGSWPGLTSTDLQQRPVDPDIAEARIRFERLFYL